MKPTKQTGVGHSDSVKTNGPIFSESEQSGGAATSAPTSSGPTSHTVTSTQDPTSRDATYRSYAGIASHDPTRTKAQATGTSSRVQSPSSPPSTSSVPSQDPSLFAETYPARSARVLARGNMKLLIYIAVAALALVLMWMYQMRMSRDGLDNGGLVTSTLPTTVTGDVLTKPDAIAVQAPVETMQRPAKEKVDVVKPFYDVKAQPEVRQTAMTHYADSLSPHMGIDFARSDRQPFEVVAAMSGKVTLVEKHPLVGHQIEITHANGLVTVYQSLSDVQVTKDAQVRKGDVIAKAGRNEWEKDEGAHVHFEVRQVADGSYVNPEAYIPPQ